MYEIPKTYEEARKILIASTKDTLKKHIIIREIIKWLIVIVFGTGMIDLLVLFLFGSHAPAAFIWFLIVLLGIEGLISLISIKGYYKRILDGRFFAMHTEEETIHLASRYAKIANIYEERKMKRKMKKG